MGRQEVPKPSPRRVISDEDADAEALRVLGAARKTSVAPLDASPDMDTEIDLRNQSEFVDLRGLVAEEPEDLVS